MAALYGRLQGNRGEATRTGSKDSGITSQLETWEGSVRTELSADGEFRVYMGDKHFPHTLVVEGNVNDRTLSWVPTVEETHEPR